MNTKKAILVGCGVFGLLALAAVVGVAMFVMYVAKDVEGVKLGVRGPEKVRVGEVFKLQVTVRNERAGQPLKLTDLDLANAYLDGFSVLAVTPEPKSNMHVPIDNSRSYTFDQTIPAGETATFSFELRAEKAGLFRGDVDVCEGMRFVTGMAQTVVQEKAGQE